MPKKNLGARVLTWTEPFQSKIMNAFGLMTQAEDTLSAMNAMLAATERLGYRRGRLYVIALDAPHLLVSRLCYGFGNKEIADSFNAGKIVLASRSGEQHWESWLSIDEQEPRVFTYRPDGKDRQRYRLPSGVEAIVVTQPFCKGVLEKQPGDLWVDVPVMAKLKPLAKLTLQITENFDQEDLEILKVLAKMAAGLLAAFREYDRRFEYARKAAQFSTAEIAHNLLTRLGAFPVLLDRYRQAAYESPRLESINSDFKHILAETYQIVTRSKNLLSAIDIKPSRFELCTLLRRALSGLLDVRTWSLTNEAPVFVEADPHRLETALAELVTNSQEATPDPDRLRITITAECSEPVSRGRIKIVYRDNGPGISETLKERVFEDFFSYRPGRPSGTGLGLAFVRRVIEAHGGKVWEQGKAGAEFVIEIPSVQPKNAAEGRYVSAVDS
jgi:signal transduction histidine kinase